MHFQQIISFLIFISSSIAFGQDTIGLLPNETVKDHCSKVEIFDDKLALLYQDLYLEEQRQKRSFYFDF